MSIRKPTSQNDAQRVRNYLSILHERIGISSYMSNDDKAMLDLIEQMTHDYETMLGRSQRDEIHRSGNASSDGVVSSQAGTVLERIGKIEVRTSMNAKHIKYLWIWSAMLTIFLLITIAYSLLVIYR